MKRLIPGFALTLAAAAFPLPAWPGPCPEGTPKVGDLGFRHIEGSMTIHLPRDPAGRVWRFHEEPTIGEIRPGSPADGRFEDGDVITALDGLLITTRQAGERYAHLKPGVPVRLTIRRDGREQQVTVVPEAVCYDQSLGMLRERLDLREPLEEVRQALQDIRDIPIIVPEVAHSPVRPIVVDVPRPAELARPAPAPAPPLTAGLLRVSPSGWFGFGLNCEGCRIRARSQSGPPVWSFDEFPEVYFVDSDGPAARAGLRRGDVLTHIDGVSLLSEDGGRRFGAVRPGQRVRWTYRRDAGSRTTIAVASTRPDDEGPSRSSLLELRSSLRSLKDLKSLDGERLQRQLEGMQARLERLSDQEERWTQQQARAQAQRLRYSGTVGNSDLVVRGLGSVIVSKDEQTGEVVITTADATIRIRPERLPRTQR